MAPSCILVPIGQSLLHKELASLYFGVASFSSALTTKNVKFHPVGMAFF